MSFRFLFARKDTLLLYECGVYLWVADFKSAYSVPWVLLGQSKCTECTIKCKEITDSQSQDRFKKKKYEKIVNIILTNTEIKFGIKKKFF